MFTNIIGGIQPKLLYKLFKNERGDSGFIFRVLFASPEEYKIARPIHGYDIPKEFKQIHSGHVKRMYTDLPVDNGFDDPKICLLTKEATQLIAHWEDRRVISINAITDINEMNVHSGILGKIKEYAYRIAGILAVSDKAFEVGAVSDHLAISDNGSLEQITPNHYYPSQLSITEDIMRRALKAADYFYKSAVDIYDTVDNSVTAPYDILYLSTLFKMGKSVSQMADLVLKDKTKKSQMHRMLKKAIKDYPKVFGAVNN